MRSPVEAALADPWATLDALVDGPLHPGGREATARLLDRAGVDDGTRLLDVGCGAGDALSLARDRGARAVGVDRRPRGAPGADLVRADAGALPVAAGAVDVVLSECSLCLAADADRALAEARRVLAADGRLALSDVVVEGSLPDLPATLSTLCCLDGARARDDLVAAVEDAGFAIERVDDRRDDLLAMRDRVREAVDYEALLGSLGGTGSRLLDGIERLEDAAESGRIGYVSLLATPAEGRPR